MHLQEKGLIQTENPFHEDVSRKGLTSCLQVGRSLQIWKFTEYTTMTDIIVEDGVCRELQGIR